MSLRVMSWVLDHSEAKLGARLTLLVLAEYAHEDGTKAFPSVPTMAQKTRMTDRAVQDALRRLEADGAIVKTGRTKSGTNTYTVVGPFNGGGEESAPPAGEGVKMATSRGEAASPDPRTDPSEQQVHVRARAHEVNRKVVKPEEAKLAEDILSAFNEVFGTNLYADDYWRAVVMRCREHPELDLADHRALIEKAKRNPWWGDGPTPAVVYGKATVFDRTISRRDADKPGGDDLTRYDG